MGRTGDVLSCARRSEMPPEVVPGFQLSPGSTAVRDSLYSRKVSWLVMTRASRVLRRNLGRAFNIHSVGY